jgi:hypothetical protein
MFQGIFSPHLQQRWLDCVNAYSTEIPAFACLEITGSTQPSPVDGRTILQVTRPTEDSLPVVAFNGPMSIPVGGYGVCTMDLPAWSMYDTGDTPAVGETWGSTEDEFYISLGKAGIKIIGGTTTSGGQSIVRVAAGSPPPVYTWGSRGNTLHPFEEYSSIDANVIPVFTIHGDVDVITSRNTRGFWEIVFNEAMYAWVWFSAGVQWGGLPAGQWSTLGIYTQNQNADVEAAWSDQETYLFSKSNEGGTSSTGSLYDTLTGSFTLPFIDAGDKLRFNAWKHGYVGSSNFATISTNDFHVTIVAKPGFPP